MGVTVHWKSLLLRVCPDGLLAVLKKFHYARVLRAGWRRDPEFAVIEALVGPGTHAVDVGANFGAYSAHLSRLVGPSGVVTAVEPVPNTFGVLAGTVRRLGLGNVRVVNLAASDEDGPLSMEVPRYPSGGKNYYEARVSGGGSPGGLRTVRVEARTLDRLFADCRPPVGFVKLDVEGHELACLRGAAALLRRVRPAWLVEVSAATAAEVFALFAARGYAPYHLDGGGVLRPGAGGPNTFFLLPAHRRRLPEK